MRRKSDHAFVITCSPGYDFGLISLMNAQEYFKTDADWEIAYEGFTQEQMDAISKAFSFNVNWTPISSLIPSVIDRRTDKTCSLERFWIGYWLLAHKLLRERQYKAVCVTQADQFTFTNLDVYFKIAESGVIVSTDYPFSYTTAQGLPFGDDKAIWDRSQCAIFDSLNFIGQQYYQMPMDIVNYQAEDAFRGEANHSVIALNRAACKHLTRDKILGLAGNLWVCDNIWGSTTLHLYEDKVYNQTMNRLCGAHNRWWQHGRVEAELAASRKDGLEFATQLANYNLVKHFMERFNNMKPEIASQNYVKGIYVA